MYLSKVKPPIFKIQKRIRLTHILFLERIFRDLQYDRALAKVFANIGGNAIFRGAQKFKVP